MAHGAPGFPPIAAQAKAPAGDRPWSWGLMALVSTAALAGLVASATAGVLRRASTLALLLCALALAAATGLRRVEAPAHAMGGPGYLVPRQRRVQVVHAVVTLLYNVGIVAIVLASLVRFGAVGGDFAPAVLRSFPLFLGLYVFLLGLATRWRVEEIGGVLHNWTTRIHGTVLAVLAVPILALAAALLVRTEVDVRVWTFVEADFLVLCLVGVLGVGTQLFLSVNLPTLFDLGRLFRRRDAPKATPAETPPVVYAGLIALAGTAIVGFLLQRFDVLGAIGGFRNDRVVVLLALLPVALSLFFAVSALQIWRESRRGLYKRKVPRDLRNAITLYALSSLLGGTFTLFLFLNLTHNLPTWWAFHEGRELSKDLTVLAILTTAGPVGWFLHRRNRNVDAIEERLPDFLNDLAETRRAGLTLAASLQSVSLSDYGALTPEIKKMAVQVSWGISFTEALAQFAQRVKTGLVARSTSLIIEASKTGGSVAEILKAAARDAYEIKAIEADRRVSMMTYLIVIYVVFFVFMTVIAVLDAQFLPEVLKANQAVAESDIGAAGSTFGGGTTLDREGMRFIYFNAAIVQAIGNGLVGGVLSEGRVTAGLRHVAFMALSSWLVFRFLLAL